MQKYVKTYFDYFDYKVVEEIPCEACGKIPIADVHHIRGRGEGMDTIKNLIGLCRKCHDRAHNSKHYVSKGEFQLIHNYFLTGARKQFLT
ncbi:MAG: HNH endonuclease signature motif containing protein [bacterium]